MVFYGKILFYTLQNTSKYNDPSFTLHQKILSVVYSVVPD